MRRALSVYPRELKDLPRPESLTKYELYRDFAASTVQVTLAFVRVLGVSVSLLAHLFSDCKLSYLGTG